MQVKENTELIVTGEHSSSKSNDDVKGIFIMDQTLENIPMGLDNFFKNVEALQIYNSGLKVIRSEDIQQFHNLEVLSLFKNELTTIDGNLFVFNQRLKFLELTENKLEHVGSELFEGLNYLDDVRFLRNPCVDKSAATREDIQSLNLRLPLLCPEKKEDATLPPRTTPEDSQECSAGCVERFEVLENKFSDIVAAYEERIIELEKKMREITASPCGCFK